MRTHLRDHPGESELDARIQNFELAARMQLAAGEVLDMSKETEATRKLYGLDDPVTAQLWAALPDGAAAGGGGRALRAGDDQSRPALGPPQQHQTGHAEDRDADGPGRRRRW